MYGESLVQLYDSVSRKGAGSREQRSRGAEGQRGRKVEPGAGSGASLT